MRQRTVLLRKSRLGNYYMFCFQLLQSLPSVSVPHKDKKRKRKKKNTKTTVLCLLSFYGGVCIGKGLLLHVPIAGSTARVLSPPLGF